jgi:Carboxypeptidase regulatory-like domain
VFAGGRSIQQQRSGRRRGPERAVVPGVTVTARNLDTQTTSTAQTNETGVYRLSSLAPGRYEITAEISGFQPAKTEVRLETAQIAGVNLRLAVAGATEQVAVTGQADVFDLVRRPS